MLFKTYLISIATFFNGILAEGLNSTIFSIKTLIKVKKIQPTIKNVKIKIRNEHLLALNTHAQTIFYIFRAIAKLLLFNP